MIKTDCLLKLLIIISAILTNQHAAAQIFPSEFAINCTMSEQSVPNQGNIQNQDCSQVYAYLSDAEYHVPFIPTADDPEMLVNVNLLFVQRADGTGHFNQSDTEAMEVWDEIEIKVNDTFSQLIEPSYIGNNADCQDPFASFISDTKIRFQFIKVFINDDAFFDDSDAIFDNPEDEPPGIYEVYQDYLDNLYPELRCRNAINVAMPTNAENLNDVLQGFSYDSDGQNEAIYDFFDLMSVDYAVLSNLYSKYIDMRDNQPNTTEYPYPWDPDIKQWFINSTARGLEHELGHAMGLMHYNAVHDNQECENSIMDPAGDSPGNYLPPSEIGKLHRNFAFASPRNRVDPSSYSNIPIEISTDQTWDNDRKLYRPLLIKNGATFTLTCKLLMNRDAKIMIEPGGTLIVDGGVLTGYCNDFWEGIEVWGDFNQHQYAFNGNEYHQGRVIFKNGAIVQNAREAIRNWKPGDWSSTGGIIQADNSTFINCRRVAEFMSYQNFSPSNPSLNRPDASYFYECTFQLDDEYPEDLNQFIPEARLSFWKMDRIKIEGCTFENLSETPLTSEARSIGIRAHDSNIIVREHCNDQFPEYGNCDLEIENDFIGWFRGIESLESISSRPISVSRSNFNKNMQGIYLGGSNFSRIFDNDFYLGDHPFTEFQQTESEGPETNLGISSNETFHFTIYENEFEGVNSEVLSHGVLIKNSGGNDNVVYHNNFTGLNESANGWQINRNISAVKDYIAGELGLQFNCNSNQNNLHDFRVMRTNEGNLTEFNNSGIRTNQGEPFAAYGGAGNVFTPGGNPLPYEYGHWAVDIDNNLFIRYNEYSQFNNNLLTAEMTPGTYIISYSSQNNCPTYKKDGKVSGLYEQKNTELGGLEYTYHQLIDEGNTPDMLNEIALSWPDDAWDLRDELISRSPYNSESVLIAAAEKEIMPHAMLLEVLLANPDALTSGHVIRVVSEELANPLPSYMIDLLYASRDETTLRTQMQSQLGKLHTSASTLKNLSVAEEFFSDGENHEQDSLGVFISKTKTVSSEIARASFLTGNAQFQAAVDVLDSLRINSKLTALEEYEIQKFENLITLLDAAHSGGRTIANLTLSEINQLVNIADDPDSGFAGLKAKNALCFHYDICFDEIGAPKSMASGGRKPRKEKSEILEELISSKAFPNPANDYTTITFKLLNAMENTRLFVYNNTGQLIKNLLLGKTYQGAELIDTRHFDSGLYLYEIVQDNEQIFSGKFNVVD